MPSPAKRYTQRSSPRRGAGAASSSLESVNRNPTKDGNDDNAAVASGGAESSSVARRRILNNDNNGPISMVGKRTGVTLPPRGEIPLDDDGLENADAFFAAAKSPAPGSSTVNTNSNSPGGSGSPGKAYGRRAEKARERERREEERQRRHEEVEDEGRRNATKRPDILNKNESDNDDEDDEEGEGKKPRAKSYQPTPKQPNWSNRLLHQAMGVPTEDSPQYTVLSKVSTAAPSTQGSLDTIATESRHAVRARQSQVQLERLGLNESSPAAAAEPEESAGAGGSEEEEAGPMDPPEEMSQDSNRDGEKRGVDPEEREHYLEPEDEEEGENQDDNVSAKPSAKSAASGATDALENSLEEVVDAYDNQDYDNEGNEGEGGMQFATQQEDNQFEEDANFGGGGNDGGFDDDINNNDDEDLSNDAVSNAASQHSRKSNVSQASSKQSRQSNESEKSQMSKQPSLSDVEEEEEEVPKKKMAKKSSSAKTKAPITPTSVLRTKKSKKKKQTNNRVNWSTPNGTSVGIPAGNREYEHVPVSDYKEQYAPGEEPKTPGGSNLRRSRRARFKPLQFWKNEKLLYEAQNEQGMLGEAMGDMPVVAGVMHALPTPYKEVKRKETENNHNKKGKKRGRGGSDEEDSDGDTKRTKSPFDDKALRKKYRIHNGESGSVWSETLESATDIKLVSRLDNRSFSKLPLSSTRKKRESKVVGFASQAFHVPTDDDDLFPGYISGNVVLPPRGIKDAEGVGLCSQVFNVGDCQANSLEFALADPSGQDGEFDPKSAQRFLLSKGDMFQIPPGNVYRIENHSKTEKANLFWTIIKCTSRAEQEDSEEEEE